MLNQLQRGDEPALLPCRRSGFLRRPYKSPQCATTAALPSRTEWQCFQGTSQLLDECCFLITRYSLQNLDDSLIASRY